MAQRELTALCTGEHLAGATLEPTCEDPLSASSTASGQVHAKAADLNAILCPAAVPCHPLALLSRSIPFPVPFSL